MRGSQSKHGATCIEARNRSTRDLDQTPTVVRNRGRCISLQLEMRAMLPCAQSTQCCSQYSPETAASNTGQSKVASSQNNALNPLATRVHARTAACSVSARRGRVLPFAWTCVRRR
eukprot:208276-Pleurochrysis_carterae.AAC.17